MNNIKNVPLKELLEDKAVLEREIKGSVLHNLSGHTSEFDAQNSHVTHCTHQQMVAVINRELKERGYKE